MLEQEFKESVLKLALKMTMEKGLTRAEAMNALEQILESWRDAAARERMTARGY
jgi:hypothetical protein